MAKKKQRIELIGKRRGNTSRKYKILIDARGIHKTTGRYNRGLLKYLPEFDTHNEYHVLINPDDQGSWKPESTNFHLHIIPYKHYSFGEQLGFAKFLYKQKADLVHFMMPQQPIFYFGRRVTSILDLTLVRFQNLDKNKFIYTIEQIIFTQLLKNVAKRSKQVITISQFVKKDIAEFTRISKQKITVTYPSAEALAVKKPVAVASLQEKKYILYVGNAFPHKNLDALVEAFVLFQADNPEYHLVFVGKKDFFYNQLQSKVKTHNHNNIHFLGFVPDDQLAWLYTHAQLYVFPSLSEGFGLPGLEAMVYNLPVASSNATCLPEVYGKAAIYFNPNDIEDISRAIKKVTKSSHLQSTLKKNGTKRLSDFSWRVMAQQTHKVYLKALK